MKKPFQKLIACLLLLTLSTQLIAAAPPGAQVEADPPDLSVTLTASPDDLYYGEPVNFTVTVTNVGGTTASSTSLSFAPLVGMADSQLSADNGATWSAWEQPTPPLPPSVTLADLSPGASVTYLFRATITEVLPPRFPMSAAVFCSGDANATNNYAGLDMPVSYRPCDLSVALTGPASGAAPGEPFVLTGTIRNNGPHNASGVEFSSNIADFDASAELSLDNGATWVMPQSITDPFLKIKAGEEATVLMRAKIRVQGTLLIVFSAYSPGDTALSDNIAFLPLSIKTAVSAISLSESELALVTGEKRTLTATVTPPGALHNTVMWTVSGDAVTIERTGNRASVTAVKPGKAEVIAVSPDGVMSACKVTVYAPGQATAIRLPESLNVEAGKAARLPVVTVPDKASGIQFTSSNEAVAVVLKSGAVVGLKPGSAVITATSANGKIKAACKVRVSSKAVALKALSLNKSGSAALLKGQTLQLRANLSPALATVTAPAWSSSKKSVATVDALGLITAKAPGTAVITAKVGDKSAKLTIVVGTKAATGVKLSKANVTLEKGKSVTLKATVSPKGVSPSALAWASDKASVAAVKNGRVTAKGKGSATITATTWNGRKASCRVSVK